jgi:hypothetical protein
LGVIGLFIDLLAVTWAIWPTVDNSAAILKGAAANTSVYVVASDGHTAVRQFVPVSNSRWLANVARNAADELILVDQLDGQAFEIMDRLIADFNEFGPVTRARI